MQVRSVIAVLAKPSKVSTGIQPFVYQIAADCLLPSGHLDHRLSILPPELSDMY